MKKRYTVDGLLSKSEPTQASNEQSTPKAPTKLERLKLPERQKVDTSANHDEEKAKIESISKTKTKDEIIDEIVIEFIRENNMRMTETNIDDVTALVKKEWEGKNEQVGGYKFGNPYVRG